ncbi:MAG: hypothetical protein ACP5JJ_14515 [Anaerolineae bacterium]
MKRKSLLAWVVLALLIVTVLGPQPATARAVRTEFTGTETPIQLIDPGDSHVLPNGGVHIRGKVFQAAEVATDPRVSGTSMVVSNGNLDPSGTGPIWGTFVIEVPSSQDCQGGGRWEGTWAGQVSYSEYYCYWHVVTHGVSGCVEGLQASYYADCLSGISTYSGTILDPHGE